jgi:hypothetical protein
MVSSLRKILLLQFSGLFLWEARIGWGVGGCGSVPSCCFGEVGGFDEGSLAPGFFACGGRGRGGFHGGLFDHGCFRGGVAEGSVDGGVCGHVECIEMVWRVEVEFMGDLVAEKRR